MKRKTRVSESKSDYNVGASTSSDSSSRKQRELELSNNDAESPRSSDLECKNTYETSELKRTLHGIIYQLKHLMLIMNRAPKIGDSIRLATEMKKAEKFDDVVLKYTDKKTKKLRHRFVQLKHSQSDSQKITPGDLLAKSNKKSKNPFSIKKYFNSWCKIKKCSDFLESEVNFILCTNFGLDIEGLKKKKIEVSEETDEDEFLKVPNNMKLLKQPRRYKLAVDAKSELYRTIKTGSDAHQLADALAQRLYHSKTIDRRTPIFSEYYVALKEENVLDARTKKFSNDFVKKKNLNERADKLREILFQKMKNLDKTKFKTDDDIEKTLLNFQILSPGFVDEPELENESEDDPVTELPDDYNIDYKDFKSFLGEFTLAVHQPNEVQLGEIIEQEMGRNIEINLPDASLIKNAYLEYMLNWLKEKSGIFLEGKDFDKFLKEICGKLSLVMAMGFSLDYSEELDKYGIRFKQESLIKFSDSMQEFLGNSTKMRILKLVSKIETSVTALRLQQAVANLETPEKNAFLFICVKTLLRSKITEKVLLAFAYAEDHNLLIIDYKSIGNEKDSQLWDQWNKIVKNLTEDKLCKKRIILIIPGNDCVDIPKNMDCESFCEKENDISFENLDTKSQKNLLEKEVVNFQGQNQSSFKTLLGLRDSKNIVVAELEDLPRMIDVNTLVKLIQSEPIKIGSEVTGLGDVERYYIDREIVHRVGVRKKYHQEDEFLNDDNRRIVILCGAAGMGKSVLLTKLGLKIKKKEPSPLVIRVDLSSPENTQALNEGQKKKLGFDEKSIDEAVDFLVDNLIKPDSGSQIFKGLIKAKDRAALLFDGFDEISPRYENIVMDLLQALASLEVRKLFVTTRPHTSKALEDKLGVASHTLQRFSELNQKTFFIKFWKRKLSAQDIDEEIEKRFQSHALDLINLLATSINDPLKEFTGVPLQAKMVAEAYTVVEEQKENDSLNCIEVSRLKLNFPKLPERIRIIELYRIFVEKICVRYCEEKKRTNKTIESQEGDDDMTRDIFKAVHQKFALDALFGEKQVKTLMRSKKDLKTYLKLWQKGKKGGGESTGFMIQGVDPLHSKPRFVHRTFAEYFAAIFLISVLKKDSENEEVREFFVSELFIEPEHQTLRAFLNCLLPADKIMNAPNKEPWSLDLYKNPDAHDGRTVYHIAAEERNTQIVIYFLNSLDPWCKKDSTLRNIDIKDRKGRTALHVAIHTPTNFELVKRLVEGGADTNSLDKDGRTPLHYAAAIEAGDLKMVKYLADNGAVIDEKCGHTPLHSATANACRYLAIAKYLSRLRQEIGSPAKYGTTTLAGDSDMVQLLVAECANVNLNVANSPTPERFADDALCNDDAETSSDDSEN